MAMRLMVTGLTFAIVWNTRLSGGRGGEFTDRRRRHRDGRDRDVQHRADDKCQRHGAGNVAVWRLGFLYHIGEVLEADESEKREQAGIADAGQRAGIERRQGKRGRDRDPGMDAGDDDDGEAAGFDQREQAGEQHRLQNAPGGDRAERGQHRRDDDALRPIDELPDITGGAERNRGRGYDADQDRHQPGERGGGARAERRPHIGRFAGAHRKACRQFGVGTDGKGHGQGGQQERPRRIAAGVAGDGADQHIDAGADGDADAVKHQQRQPEPAPQRDRQLERRLVVHGGRLTAERRAALRDIKRAAAGPAPAEPAILTSGINTLIYLIFTCILPELSTAAPPPDYTPRKKLLDSSALCC